MPMMDAPPTPGRHPQRGQRQGARAASADVVVLGAALLAAGEPADAHQAAEIQAQNREVDVSHGAVPLVPAWCVTGRPEPPGRRVPYAAA